MDDHEHKSCGELVAFTSCCVCVPHEGCLLVLQRIDAEILQPRPSGTGGGAYNAIHGLLEINCGAFGCGKVQEFAGGFAACLAKAEQAGWAQRHVVKVGSKWYCPRH